jgi:hypothetical protein
MAFRWAAGEAKRERLNQRDGVAAPGDGELAALLLQGSDATFAAVYLCYCDRAHRVGRIGSVSRARAEDAVQGAFAEIWSARSAYSSDRAAFRRNPPVALVPRKVAQPRQMPQLDDSVRSGSRCVAV